MLPTIKLNIERWKYNPTFELYVSNIGHIRNKSKADIAPKIMESGYVVVYVYGSLNRYMLLHRVVMLTWKPTPEAEALTVDHLDHNKRNNALSNLEWVTKEENLRRAKEDFAHGVTMVGNDLIFNKKVEQKAAIKNCLVKHVPGNIEYFYICKKGTTKSPSVDFVIKADMSDFDEKVAPLIGRVNNFTPIGLKKVMTNMLTGENAHGAKTWCTLVIKAVYADGCFNNKARCPLNQDGTAAF